MSNTWEARRAQWSPFRCKSRRHVNPRQLNDTLDTRVKGKLPGNIDLVIRGFANERSGYIHDIFMEWFEEHKSTTINLRILGVDRVSPLLFISDMGGPLMTHAVFHYGLRTHQVLAGDRPRKFLPRGYPERAAVSPPQSSPVIT